MVKRFSILLLKDRPLSRPTHWSGWSALLLLLLSPILRIFWLSDGWDDRLFAWGASLLAVALAVGVSSGDWINRFCLPLILCAVGWPWLLAFVALRGMETAPTQWVVRAIETLVHRAVTLVRHPQQETPGIVWSSAWRRRCLCAFFLAALPVNMLAFRHSRQSDVRGVDGRWYLQAGDNILTTGEFFAKHPLPADKRQVIARAARMPGYPLFLAGCKLLAGARQVRLASAMQSCGNAGAVVLIFLLAEAIYSSLAGLLAALLYILYAPFSFCAPRILTEPLAIPLYLLAMLLIVKAYRAESASAWAMAGLTLGLATWLRTITFFTPFFLSLYLVYTLWRAGRSFRPRLHVLPLLLAFAAVMAPWWIRNALVFRTFVPTTTIGGHVAWGGNYLPYKGVPREYNHRLFSAVLRRCGDNEILADRVMTKMAREQMKENLRQPRALVNLFTYKVHKLMLEPYISSGFTERLHPLLFLLAAIGVLSLRHSPASGLMGAFFLSIVLLHLATYAGEARFFLPVMPFVIVWAGTALAQLSGVQTRQAREHIRLDTDRSKCYDGVTHNCL